MSGITTLLIPKSSDFNSIVLARRCTEDLHANMSHSPWMSFFLQRRRSGEEWRVVCGRPGGGRRLVCWVSKIVFVSLGVGIYGVVNALDSRGRVAVGQCLVAFFTGRLI